MNHNTFRVRCAMTLVLVAGAAASRDASATGQCTFYQTGGGVYNTSTYSTEDPSSLPYCELSQYYLTTGPGAAFLAQDQSANASATYAIEATSVSNTAIYGQSGGSSNAVYGYNNASSGGGYGVYGDSVSNYGVYGTSSDSAGVYGTTSSSTANGVIGSVSNTYSGVVGENTGTGCSGNPSCVGVYGSSTNGDAVYGTSGENATNFAAGYFTATSTGSDANGVAAIVAGTGTGLYARTLGGNGVYAIDQGSGSSGYGVYATSENGTAVDAVGGGTGLAASASGSGSLGVYSTCSGSGCWAGYFSGRVDVTGELTVGSCSGCTSDIRLKKNVKPVADAIEQLLNLKGVTFEWIEPKEHEHEAGHGEGTQIGFIAQDVEKVFPNMVKQDGYTAPDGQKYKTLEMKQIEALEVESIRTLKMENEAMTQRLSALESGSRPRISGIDLNSVGFAMGGLAIGVGMFFVSGRRREEPSAPRTIS